MRNLSCPCLGFYSLNVCFRVFFIQNTQVTDTWNKIAHSFHCTPIEGEAWGRGVVINYTLTEIPSCPVRILGSTG